MSRLAAVLLGSTLLALVWLGPRVYRGRAHPEAQQPLGPGGLLGPPGAELLGAARLHMGRGLEALNDRDLSDRSRIDTFREELQRAESLLIESLQARPSQPDALASLAAVRWELSGPVSAEAVSEVIALVEMAASLAPNRADVQQDLGALLLEMGRRDEAMPLLARALELEPVRAEDVVGVLEGHVVPAREMLAGLPLLPETLAALASPFLAEGLDRDYLVAVERALAAGHGSAVLLQAYAGVCRSRGELSRLHDILSGIEPLANAGDEAERWLQLARASVELGRPAEAAAAAERGRSIVESDSVVQARAGSILLAADRPEAALNAYRDALAAVAAVPRSNPRWRAQLYRSIGETRERLGQIDLAYDAYRRALSLDPEEGHAARRVQELRDAAGVPTDER